MKATNGEIFDIQKPMGELAPQKMPVKTSLAVLKLRELTNPIAGRVEEMRRKLIKEYGEVSPTNPQDLHIQPTILSPDPEHEGRMLQEVNPKWAEFLKDFQEVRGVEVELECEPIVLPENIELSPAALMALEKFVKV